MTSMEEIVRLYSVQLWVDKRIIQSWWEHLRFATNKEAEDFFMSHAEMIKAKPFVKWVGGKRQIIPQLQLPFPTEFCDYFEPFLGGWAVFFSLQKKQSYLSDINEELINAYQVIKESPKKLIEFLKSCEYSKNFYAQIRSWDREGGWQKKYSKIQRAGRFIYLNRTCFNGLHRVNSRWEFNVPMGAYKNPDFVQEENLLNTSKLLNKTEAVIRVQSFEHVLENAKPNDFVYLDPPYDVLTETSNFTSYNKEEFGRDMQIKLRDVFVELDKRWVKVMLSNHDTPFIREIYDWYEIRTVKARRNVNSKAGWRGEVEEVVVVNY